MPNMESAWRALQAHQQATNKLRLGQLLDQPGRAQQFQANTGPLTLDYSYNRITRESLVLLEALFTECAVSAHARAMMAGERVNTTEHRPALHTALRAPCENHDTPNQEEIQGTLATMRQLVETSYSDASPLRDVVSIGIGGSDLGPRMAGAALAAYNQGKIRVHYVSSLDAAEINQLLPGLSPASTLFLVSSKSFGTEETLRNAERARAWLASSPDDNAAENMMAITANSAGASHWGIPPERQLPLWDWVGGRYSLWSAIGLPVMFSIGPDNFDKLLAGAASMDAHFASAPFGQNLPMLMAAIEIWHRNINGYATQAILPYSYGLRLLPKYLQQLVMESNGKSVNTQGLPVGQATSPIIWGEAGTEGQHSFCQLLHQGTDTVPVDFILPATASTQADHNHLIAHCLAQREAMARGESHDTLQQRLLSDGMAPDEAFAFAAHKAVAGDKPSNLLVLDSLSPEALGHLLALYEHKTFASSVVWGINPFDQWGVELGKRLSSTYYQQLESAEKETENSAIALIRSRQTHSD